MAAVFLAPNMAIFFVFVLLPLVINFAYSATGGTALFLPSAPMSAPKQYGRLLTCGNYADPLTLHRGPVLDRIRNTGLFVVLQTALMVGAALVTALILNREIRGRSFWRAMFFFPVLLSPSSSASSGAGSSTPGPSQLAAPALRRRAHGLARGSHLGLHTPPSASRSGRIWASTR